MRSLHVARRPPLRTRSAWPADPAQTTHWPRALGPVTLWAVLMARELQKSYDEVQALRGVDLEVASGQIVSLLGRNGAGKTTMISIIAGLLVPDGGTAHINEVDALQSPDVAARFVGIAPQETGVYSILTVRQNLEFFGELNGLSKAAKKKRAAEVSEQLGLVELLDRQAQKLSGGETRRLHTACALVHTPSLLMLDEPTVGADVTTRAQLIDAVKDLADKGAAIVYTTHYLPEVETLGADVVIIDKGEILACGTQTELIAQHELRGVRFELDGDLPKSLQHLEPIEVALNTYRVLGDLSMSDLLGMLGSDCGRLVSVESLKPDLETVFLKVTGRRLSQSTENGEGGVR